MLTLIYQRDAASIYWNRLHAVNITRLPHGKPAQPSADRIHVWQSVSGGFEWSGMILRDKLVVFGRKTAGHASRTSAEADGIAWAESHGAAYLVIESEG
jgi:hypothetical protein